jgi:chromosome segregation ATPase
MTDKPARLITKLTTSLGDKNAEIAELTAQLRSQRERAVAAEAAASDADAKCATMQQQVAKLEIYVSALDELNVAATDALDDLESKYEGRGIALAMVATELRQVTADREMLACSLAAIGPQIALLDEQRAGLTKILDGVRDRMRRREREEETAILTRQALASTRYAVNRR